jgi:hypothetical protein
MWNALGWLGKMACQSTLIEVFSRAVPEDAARDCVRKQLSLHHELTLASKEDPVPLRRLFVGMGPNMTTSQHSVHGGSPLDYLAP